MGVLLPRVCSCLWVQEESLEEEVGEGEGRIYSWISADLERVPA